MCMQIIPKTMNYFRWVQMDGAFIFLALNTFKFILKCKTWIIQVKFLRILESSTYTTLPYSSRILHESTVVSSLCKHLHYILNHLTPFWTQVLLNFPDMLAHRVFSEKWTSKALYKDDDVFYCIWIAFFMTALWYP